MVGVVYGLVVVVILLWVLTSGWLSLEMLSKFIPLELRDSPGATELNLATRFA